MKVREKGRDGPGLGLLIPDENILILVNILIDAKP